MPTYAATALQGLLDRRAHLLRLILRAEPLDDLAVGADEELREVPLDALHPQEARRLTGQPAEERIGGVAVHVDLGHHRKCHTVVQLAELGDLVVAAGVLVGELVAREADDGQAPVLVLGVQFLEPGELRGEPALARGVDHDQNLAAIITEIDLGTIACGDLEVIDAHDSSVRGGGRPRHRVAQVTFTTPLQLSAAFCNSLFTSSMTFSGVSAL